MSHPDVVFSLQPLNEGAHAVAAHGENQHLVSEVERTRVLNVGHFDSSSGMKTTLATLGRGQTVDIYIPNRSIAKVQCSFEVSEESKAVMLYDQSHQQTTQVFGGDVRPFEHGRVRHVIVHNEFNNIIGMGGEKRDLIRFKIVWQKDPLHAVQEVQRKEKTKNRKEHFRLARTMDEADTELPSQRQTRIHTPSQVFRIRHFAFGADLGSGQFGTVQKTIDVDCGKLMAVKILKRPAACDQVKWEQSQNYALKREIETLSRITHPSVVDYLGSQGWGEATVEIFMGLKEGNLATLVTFRPQSQVADSVLKQMLQALDCLAVNSIIHRDVKPENILYTSLPEGQFEFQLGDFGLCNRTIDARTYAGSPTYMAPELYQSRVHGGGVQTPGMDVWSLFVTMLWVLDEGGFRAKADSFQSHHEVETTIVDIASRGGRVEPIREMAIVDRCDRASAAQMLCKCFKGEGLSTPADRIPPLVDYPGSAAMLARQAAAGRGPFRDLQRAPPAGDRVRGIEQGASAKARNKQPGATARPRGVQRGEMSRPRGVMKPPHPPESRREARIQNTLGDRLRMPGTYPHEI